MEIFHQCFPYTPTNLSNFVDMKFPSEIYETFLAHRRSMCRNEVIDRYIALFYAESTKNAQVFLYNLADLNIGHYEKSPFFNINFGGLTKH